VPVSLNPPVGNPLPENFGWKTLSENTASILDLPPISEQP